VPGRSLTGGPRPDEPALEVRALHDIDLRVPDLVALEEIELYAEVLSAVAAADGPLTKAELDRVLGLSPPAQPTPPASADATQS
jgi:hypothetical protein